MREIGDHKYEQYSDIPLARLFFSLTVNPQVVASWSYPNVGNNSISYFEDIKETVS